MKKILGIIARVLFYVSLLYYVFWIIYAGTRYFFGIERGWLITSLSSGRLVYGWEAVANGLIMGVCYTIFFLWAIPLYQIIYLICVIVRKAIKSKKASAAQSTDSGNP